ncbi:hypothetical protein OF829_02500 [Sphingomonas sp. LB-2]|uniref:hypothetical protein n=1 Tax=Sphingomonas caeni TaxID=2984949 RepID=UPI00222ED7EC|nr:hypothetical protein [Sphingomonas caeni]MCW3846091.1 hypothetical protein [Sphingomonas caeni]
MRNLIGAAAAVLLAWAAPAPAQTAEFGVGGTRYAVPAPEGYCSTGPAIDTYMRTQRGAAPDKVPDAVFARCGAVSLQPFDFFAVMVVRDGGMTLPEMQKQLRDTLPQAMHARSLLTDSARKEQERDLSDAFARNVTIDAGIQPVGMDEFCGYLAGIIHYQVEGAGSVDIMLTGCITAVGGHAVYVFHYSSGTDKASGVAALPGLKRLAQSIQARE